MQYLLTKEEHELLIAGKDEKYKEEISKLKKRLQEVAVKYRILQSDIRYNSELKHFIDDVLTALNA